MSNNTNTQGTSFWKFLTDNTIEIPIIQRDYAQGRLGKEYLRKSFLVDIKKALDNKTEMKLDFVYGSVENDTLSPLDGQQRLTTLWLLHWYIALMSGNLNEEVCKRLAKFTYETRISSREFCKNLCKPKNFNDYQEYISTEEDRKIVEYITSRTWFYSAWKQDPTIQSMLRMLGGTVINDKKGDIVDGLEELFNETTNFVKYWEKLISDDAPIVFYQLPLKDFGLSDDLYIKMNARGKQLTSFENFKADLVGYIREKTQDNPQEWNNLLDAKEGIPNKMDTTWTDIFWKNKSQDNRIDDIYFAFLNRFFLCELICQKVDDKYRERIAETSSFRYLYGKEGNDASIKYEDFGKYKYDNKEIPKTFFESLKAVLDNYTENPNLFFPKWVETEFQFIPQYRNNTISTLGQKERVVFLAVCRYLEKGKIDDSFKQWMRIVWNIVENNDAGMIGAMRLIDELGEHSHEIYKFMANEDTKIKSEAAKEQVNEEIAKVKQILMNRKYTNEGFAENVITHAESHPLLKGCISALFDSDNCEKVSFSQSLYDRVNLLNELWNKDNSEDYRLVKVLISLYDKDMPEDKLYLKKNQENWKRLVTGKLKACFRKNDKNEINVNCERWKSMLAKTDLIENSRDIGKILGSYWDGKVMLWATGGCTWNAYGNVILDDMHNNVLLKTLIKEKIITCNQEIHNCDFFWGWDINFEYHKDDISFHFQWNTDGNVYLIENNDRKKKEDGSVFCFWVDGIKDPVVFKGKLDKLIEAV